MTDLTLFFNIGSGFAGFAIALLGLCLAPLNEAFSRWERHFFTLFFLVLSLYTGSLLYELTLPDLPGYGRLSQAFIFLESFFSSLLMPMLTYLLLRWCGERLRPSPATVSVAALLLLYWALLIFTQFTTVIYSVGADGIYRRGPWYPLLLVPPALLMLVNLTIVLRRRRKLRTRQLWAVLSFLLIPLAAMLLQMLYYGLLTIALGTSVGSFVLFTAVQRDLTDQYLEQQKEVTRRELDILMLQMRPHYIHNTLMSIYYLCDSDPALAKQVCGDFAAYLQGSFTGLGGREPVSFAEELRHTKAYLAVEQARYSGQIEAVFDTPYTAFRLPALTLQPLVENAIRHGLDPERGVLHIRVGTRALDEGCEVLVEDDGAGFSDAQESNYPAIENIRTRLAFHCGGSLTLSAREGGGVRARVYLPRK